MRPSHTRWRVENWASVLVRSLGLRTPPVDLFQIAAARRIRTLELRQMVPRGGLLAVEGGFQLYVRDPRGKVLEIQGAEPEELLSVRQRFTFAHEVAHTFFYDLTKFCPAPQVGAPDYLMLEGLCGEVAGHILVPAELLRSRFSDEDELTIEVVQHVATSFNVSLTVALNRLAHVASLRTSPRCVVLAKRHAGDAQIKAFCFSAGLLPALPRPMRFSQLAEWLPEVAHKASMRRQDHWETVNAGRTVTFRKLELGDSDAFLLQAEARDQFRAARTP